PRCVILSKHVRFCRIAARFLNRWPMSRDGEANGTGASHTSTKPSGSTRATLTYSPRTQDLPLYSGASPKRCESLIRFSILYRTTWIPLQKRRLLHKRRATFRGLLQYSPYCIQTPPTLPALGTQVYQAILERRPAQIINRLKEVLAKPDPA